LTGSAVQMNLNLLAAMTPGHYRKFVDVAQKK
jgi:hypothetical protein